MFIEIFYFNHIVYNMSVKKRHYEHKADYRLRVENMIHLIS
jgi:hypothetical protein